MWFWPFKKKRSVDRSPFSPTEHFENVISIFSPLEWISLGGLPVEGIAGRFEGVEPSVEAFRPNQAFIDFMHHAIRSAGPQDPDLKAAAKEQGDGWAHIIDLRTPEGPDGRVPPEDIIGAFEVKDGRIIANSYWANEKHCLYTRNGLVCLPPFLRRALVKRLPKIS